MKTWHHILNKLETGNHLILLWVLQSEGSSPGRRGFQMVVSSDGEISGTIGGGIMEHKLVEKARVLLQEHQTGISIVSQYHDKEHSKDRSGMICSGSQQIAIVPLFGKDLPLVRSIVAAGADGSGYFLHLSPDGIVLKEEGEEGLAGYPGTWTYSEKLSKPPVLHIIGSGHVGLALSEVMHFLGFYIRIYDDRPELNTLAANRFADEKIFVDYKEIGEKMNCTPEDLVVIMTMGYRDDLVVFRQLMKKKFSYLGMLGSEKKIDTLLSELGEEGITKEDLKDLFIPVGLQIFSKTPQEISISIAAEIILHRNKSLPTGRTATPATEIQQYESAG